MYDSNNNILFTYLSLSIIYLCFGFITIFFRNMFAFVVLKKLARKK